MLHFLQAAQGGEHCCSFYSHNNPVRLNQKTVTGPSYPVSFMDDWDLNTRLPVLNATLLTIYTILAVSYNRIKAL